MKRQREIAIKTLEEVNSMSQSSSQPTEEDEKDDLDLEDLSATNFFEVNQSFETFSFASLVCVPNRFSAFFCFFVNCQRLFYLSDFSESIVFTIQIKDLLVKFNAGFVTLSEDYIRVCDLLISYMGISYTYLKKVQRYERTDSDDSDDESVSSSQKRLTPLFPEVGIFPA